MLKKTLTLAVLAAVGLGGLFAAGCASNNSKPYALTGQSDGTISPAEQKERLRYTDQKGRYRPDLRLMGLPQRP